MIPSPLDRGYHGGLIVITGAADLGTMGAQPFGKAFRYASGQIDNRLRAKNLCPRRHRQAVIACTGGDEHLLADIALLRQMGDHIGGAKRLETAKPHALAFILDEKRGIQPFNGLMMERGFAVVGAAFQQFHRGDSINTGEGCLRTHDMTGLMAKSILEHGFALSLGA